MEQPMNYRPRNATLTLFGTLFGALFLLGAAGCGSVTVPEPTWYLLPTPEVGPALAAAPMGEGSPTATVVRVGHVRLAGGLPADGLVFAPSPVRRLPSSLHRWLGPLDSMVADAMVTALSRTGRFAQVLTAGERGTADLTLDVRLTAFHLQADLPSHDVRAMVGLWLTVRDRDDQALSYEEFTATRQVPDGDPETGVNSLAQALGEVLGAAMAALPPPRPAAENAGEMPSATPPK